METVPGGKWFYLYSLRILTKYSHSSFVWKTSPSLVLIVIILQLYIAGIWILCYVGWQKIRTIDIKFLARRFKCRFHNKLTISPIANAQWNFSSNWIDIELIVVCSNLKRSTFLPIRLSIIIKWNEKAIVSSNAQTRIFKWMRGSVKWIRGFVEDCVSITKLHKWQYNSIKNLKTVRATS